MAVKRDICIQISDWQTCRQVIRRLTAYDKTLYSVHWISCSCRCWPAAGPAPTAFDTVAVDTWSLLADWLDTMFSSSSQHFYTTEMYCWTTRLSICSRLLFKPQARCIQKSGVHHQYTHTHMFNGPLSGTTWIKGKTNVDFTEARDSEWQWLSAGPYASLNLTPDW